MVQKVCIGKNEIYLLTNLIFLVSTLSYGPSFPRLDLRPKHKAGHESKRRKNEVT